MEGEEQIAETLCDVAEELPWRKLLNRGRGGIDATQTDEEKAPSAAPSASWTDSVTRRERNGEALAPPA